ncbi:H-NS family nucleoid-associated regulatory protein [Luteimonas abyssi]|jgi:DNA-binding protein H-NS|uniref:H-NS histone family protein n=1 Tax=Luteimonas abyssi TaxID=1247514 RepID=UPI000737C60E|nr:H-NS family nucleoid-associated regulatory protein [Luteimonas abyssi]
MSNSPTLDSIASARAKLEDELRKLETQESELRQQQAEGAFSQVMTLLEQYAEHFNGRQRSDIVAAVGGTTPSRKPAGNGVKREVPPKYWLPHSGDTWTGRGRTPRSFAAWQETSAYKEWKARHPDEKFPKFPG